jgi:DNA-directed RNA polymerase subunit beta
LAPVWRKSASDSRVLIHAEGDGVVEYVDADEIKIRYSRKMKDLVSFEDDVKSIQLIKFSKTNQSTCINLKPIVRKGQKVKKGQLLSEGYATKGGELGPGS